MATDTAFAIGILALLGNRVPAALTAFLLALAIIDDMGAVVIIALYYTDAISTLNIVAAAGVLATLALANYLGVRRPVVYLIGGVLVWLAMLGSGVHATLAGIMVAATIPARPTRGSREFLQRTRRLAARFEDLARGTDTPEPILAAPEKLKVVEKVQQTAEETATPLQLWERTLEHPIALFVLPLFALANAGVALEFDAIPDLFVHPLTLGIVLGLVSGKAVGVLAAAFAVTRLGIGKLPEGICMHHLPGLGLIAGVGFTMSVFIASLGFSGNSELLELAKVGILTGSLIAGTLGYAALRVASRLDSRNRQD
jgi:NhaA family Na+:H+ antiporter